MKPLILSTLLCVLPLLTSMPGMAQERALSPEQAEARAAYRKAQAEMGKGNWQAARTMLEDLWKKSPTFDVAASLGEAEMQLGHYPRAAQRLAFALKNVPPKEKAETSTRLRAALDELLPRVGVLQLSVNRASAEILVDGESVGTFPQLSEVYVSPGKHTIEARAGAESARREIDAAVGASIPLSLELKEEAATTPAPASPETSPPMVSPPTATPAEHEAGSPARPIALVVGGSLAVAGLAIGIGFGVASNSAESDVETFKGRIPSDGCTGSPGSADCSAWRDALADQRRNASIANVGFGIAAAGLVTVGVALLWPSPKNESARRPLPNWALRWSGDQILVDGTF